MVGRTPRDTRVGTSTSAVWAGNILLDMFWSTAWKKTALCCASSFLNFSLPMAPLLDSEVPVPKSIPWSPEAIWLTRAMRALLCSNTAWANIGFSPRSWASSWVSCWEKCTRALTFTGLAKLFGGGMAWINAAGLAVLDNPGVVERPSGCLKADGLSGTWPDWASKAMVLFTKSCS